MMAERWPSFRRGPRLSETRTNLFIDEMTLRPGFASDDQRRGWEEHTSQGWPGVAGCGGWVKSTWKFSVIIYTYLRFPTIKWLCLTRKKETKDRELSWRSSRALNGGTQAGGRRKGAGSGPAPITQAPVTPAPITPAPPQSSSSPTSWCKSFNCQPT